MSKSTLSVIKYVAAIVGTSIAGPTGAMIGSLSSSLLESILPELPKLISNFQSDILANLVTGQSNKLLSRWTASEKRLVNHDLQKAFRDAFIDAVYDIGGKDCFPDQWQKNQRIIPARVIFSESSGSVLWKTDSPLKDQVRECLKNLVKAVVDGQVLPIEPIASIPASNVQAFLDNDTQGDLTEAFFSQALEPFLLNYRALLVEVPEFSIHLKSHLLDRTLIYLGENLKQRTPAWRAYNRLVFQQIREQFDELGKNQDEICLRLDQLIDQVDRGGDASFTNGLADLLAAVGSVEKKLDEQYSDIFDRVLSQHREIVQNLEILSKTSLRIESKVDRVLKILEDGRYSIEGTPPIAEDLQPEPGVPPFQGMQFFDEKDSDRFFGREKLVAKLSARLKSKSFLAVVGASGSGKSSLIRAGLLPVLRGKKPLVDGSLPPDGCQEWEYHLITAGDHPLETLAISITSSDPSVHSAAALRDDMLQDSRALVLAARRQVLGKSSRQKVMLVVDQFEELFTLCRDEKERKAFIDNIISAASTDGGGPLVVIITLRADFYDQCGRYPQLRVLLQNNQEYIGPMSPDELRCAIEEPARLGGWHFESGLPELILRDVGEEPGALPLLSHALLETWNHRRGRMMTLESYAESGGVHSAIAKTAETVYQHGFTVEQQQIARNIFLRLIEVGEGIQETRRRVAFGEINASDRQDEETTKVLDTLVSARLLTTSNESLEIAHEALIREWPLLRSWLDEDRDDLRIHRHLSKAAQEWQNRAFDPGELYRGIRLTQVSEWAAGRQKELNSLEAKFLLASAESRDREIHNRRRILSVVISVIVLAVLILTGAVINASQQARKNAVLAAEKVASAATAESASFLAVSQKQVAQTALAESVRQEGQSIRAATIALSRQLAIQARQEMPTHPQRALLMAVEAVRRPFLLNGYIVPEAEQVLRDGLSNASPSTPVVTGPDPVGKPEISKDGKRLVYFTYALVDAKEYVYQFRWNLMDLEHQKIVWSHETKDYPAMVPFAFTEDDHWLAVATRKYIDLIDLGKNAADYQPTVQIDPVPTRILGIAIPKGNRWLAAFGATEVFLWDASKLPAKPDPIVIRLDGEFKAIDFSVDGRWMALLVDDSFSFYDLTQPGSGPAPIHLSVSGGDRSDFAISPNGNTVYYAEWGKVTAYSLLEKSSKILVTSPNYYNNVKISADGKWVAFSKRVGDFPTILQILLWDVERERMKYLSKETSDLTDMQFTPDSKKIVWSDEMGYLRYIEVQDVFESPNSLFIHEGTINRFALSPDSQSSYSGGMDGMVRKWVLSMDAAEPGRINSFFELNDLFILSTRGKLVGFHSYETSLLYWMDQAKRVNLETAREFSLSPDGKWIVSAYHDGKGTKKNSLGSNYAVASRADAISLRLASAPEQVVRRYEGMTGDVVALAFDPSGRYLAEVNEENEIQILDVDTFSNTKTIVLKGIDSMERIRYLLFSPDGNWLVAKYYEVACLISLRENHEPIVIENDGMVQFDPNSKRVVLVNGDRLTYFDLSSQTKQEVKYPFELSSLLITEKGQFAAGKGNKSIYFSRTGSEDQFTQLSGHNSEVIHLEMDPQGNLVSIDKDMNIFFWNLVEQKITTRRKLISPVNAEAVQAVMNYPNQQVIVAYYRKDTRYESDKFLVTFDLNIARLLEKACQIIGRNLTTEEWVNFMPDIPYQKTCPQWP